MRIVSLCPSNTELIGFLGLQAEIVGVDDYSDWPEAVGRLPRLGSDLDIDMDAVERLRPDLVAASLSVPGMEKNVERLRERGLPHIVLNPKSLRDIGDGMQALGEALGEEKRAERARRAFFEMMGRFEAASSLVRERPALYWEWWPKPIYSPGGGNWLTDISRLAGGRNVFEQDERSSVKTDWETVRKEDPDYLLLAWVGIREKLVKPEAVLQRPNAAELRAVKRGNVVVMEEALYCRPSPRLFAGLQKLALRLHPVAYAELAAVPMEEWLCRAAD